VSVRDRKGTVVIAVVGAAAVIVHLLAGTGVALTASQWLGGGAVAGLITVIAVLHVVGLRRLMARRSQAVARRENEE
jgi:hypothetical protein